MALSNESNTAVKLFILTLMVANAAAADTNGKYVSDEDYRKLGSFAAPSSFYPDGNSGQLQLLVGSVERGDAAMLDRLLEAVPNFVNVSEHPSRSGPAHWAAFRGDTNILAVLVKHRADLNKKATNWKITPLHIARDVSTAEFLLAHGAELEARAGHGQTPLMWAARRGNIRVAEYLLGRRAKLDSKDDYGQTAVVLAQIWKHTNMVTLLVRKGAATPPDEPKDPGIFDVTLGIFSEAPGHPFAEHKLIYGAP